MIEDPIINELHQYRVEHAASFGYDVEKIALALRERERTSNHQVLNPGPKYLIKTPVN